MADELRRTWAPRWAPHVIGRFSDRVVNDDGTAEPQRYVISCSRCGATWGPAVCTSGLVENHIAKFALSHAHRDPLTDPMPGARR